jgi:hypothetical protein
MRRRWASIFALSTVLALAGAGIATAYRPAIIPVDEPLLEISGGFRPTRLPKSKLAPIHLDLSGTVGSAEGKHLPALREMILEADRNVAIDAKGLANCPAWKIVGPDVVPPSQGGCKAARIGKGEMGFEVQFPEQAPFITKGHALAFNGGVRDGVTTIFVYAFLSSPVSEAIVSSIEVSKIHKGPYGSKWTTTIPEVAGGSGSVKEFQLELFRRFSYKGKKQSYLLAKCPTGKLQVAWRATFADASGFAGRFARPCTPTG